MATKIAKAFDIQDYLVNEEKDHVTFFRACVAEDFGDGSLVRRVFAEIAKARGMTLLAKEIRLSRQCLYCAPTPNATPSFETIFRISSALNLECLIGLVTK